MMPADMEEVFQRILTDIKSGDIKTTHNLRMVLESLSERFHIRELQILVMFREWLIERNIDLSTEHGMVKISPMVDRK